MLYKIIPIYKACVFKRHYLQDSMLAPKLIVSKSISICINFDMSLKHLCPHLSLQKIKKQRDSNRNEEKTRREYRSSYVCELSNK